MKGAYVLLLNSPGLDILVGSLGRVSIPRGLICYIGSAKGPGGLKARIMRHFRRDKVRKWHIDYLTANPEIKTLGALAVVGGDESALVKLVSELGEPLIPGFGCSDRKQDLTHLFLLRVEISRLESELSKMGKLIKFLPNGDSPST